ncbi:restriction endonuclease [Gilvimarinus sp. SDUM040013]|uniref:Restriction endonuclease n=1 Tax=Gilvimarinus gilvus TaxID=3058038 RepID=A0ABU4RUW6_9GAMM|nr:restriction endonuclease [Gilvimarinus sp. SDUM040013]MDO3387960.1 restriction endonuclease [Gilvimarinus sp. SDUM040013]MDX6848669.1 restriction endonuclease [Gilvimarinus sp. SDUM040013]
MPNNWMIRAGRGGTYIEDFETKSYAAFGAARLGDLNQYQGVEEIKAAYLEKISQAKPQAMANAVAMMIKFRDTIQKGDTIVSYDTETRQYLIGEDQGQYLYKPGEVGEYPNLRVVNWQGRVDRDALSQSAKNSLGSTLTLFSVSDDVIAEMRAALSGKPRKVEATEEALEESGSFEILKDEVVGKSHELIKDKLASLLPEEMEEMVAAILRAMGYKAKVSPKGPDRGVDVIASPDGLGLTQPRIKAEVKHRDGAMGAPAIRGFIGTLREGDSGLFISSGGFTKEARYEADRCTFPLTLVDMDDLSDLIVAHYENFDLEGRALLPLIRVFWPAE